MEKIILLHLTVIKDRDKNELTKDKYFVGFNGYTFINEKNKTKSKPATKLFTNIGIVDKKGFRENERNFEIEANEIIEGWFNFDIGNSNDFRDEILNIKNRYEADKVIIIVNRKLVNSFYKIYNEDLEVIEIKYSYMLHDDVITTTEILSKIGINSYLKQNYDPYIKEYTIKEYYTVPEKNTFFFGRQIIFTVKEIRDTYYIMNYEKENEVGKKINTITYGIYLPKEKDNLIESLKQEFRNNLGSLSLFANIYINHIYSPKIYLFLSRYGILATKFIINKGTRMRSISFLDGEILVGDVNPPGLAFRAIENSEFLEKELKSFLDNSLPSYEKIIDITDKFFIKEINKKGVEVIKLNPDITMNTKQVSLQYENLKIPYLLKTDILERNRLKRIETLNPKVYLIITDEENLIKYKTIIVTDEGSILISNLYTAVVFKRKRKKK